MSNWWAWDLYPLTPGAWPNECVAVKAVLLGHTFKNIHTAIEARRVPWLGNARGWVEGQTEAVRVQTARVFYRPTEEDLLLIRTSLPAVEPENPSWPTIQAELVAAGHQSQELLRETAPTLIRLLGNMKTRGRAPCRPTAKPKSGKTRRPKVPKRVETEVLTKSRRRCCICVGLHQDATEKRGQVAHLDQDRTNNAIDNLVYLCLAHHDEYDTARSQSKGLTMGELRAYRDALYLTMEEHALRIVPDDTTPDVESSGNSAVGSSNTAIQADSNAQVILNSPGAVQARNLTIKTSKRKVTVSPPSDAIGSNTEMRSYIEYLVKRYIEWRKAGVESGLDKRPFHPAMFQRLIQKRFGSRCNLIPQSRFPDLVAFLQGAIDNTIRGRRNPVRNYHSYEEHLYKVRGSNRS